MPTLVQVRERGIVAYDGRGCRQGLVYSGREGGEGFHAVVQVAEHYIYSGDAEWGMEAEKIGGIWSYRLERCCNRCKP